MCIGLHFSSKQKKLKYLLTDLFFVKQLSDVVKDGWASIWTNYHAKQLMFHIRNKPTMVANIAKLRTGMISVIYLSYKISSIDPIFVYKFMITFNKGIIIKRVLYRSFYLINLHNLTRPEVPFLSLYKISVDGIVVSHIKCMQFCFMRRNLRRLQQLFDRIHFMMILQYFMLLNFLIEWPII